MQQLSRFFYLGLFLATAPNVIALTAINFSTILFTVSLLCSYPGNGAKWNTLQWPQLRDYHLLFPVIPLFVPTLCLKDLRIGNDTSKRNFFWRSGWFVRTSCPDAGNSPSTITNNLFERIGVTVILVFISININYIFIRIVTVICSSPSFVVYHMWNGTDHKKKTTLNPCLS